MNIRSTVLTNMILRKVQAILVMMPRCNFENMCQFFIFKNNVYLLRKDTIEDISGYAPQRKCRSKRGSIEKQGFNTVACTSDYRRGSESSE
jgi:hypothetical protein